MTLGGRPRHYTNGPTQSLIRRRRTQRPWRQLPGRSSRGQVEPQPAIADARLPHFDSCRHLKIQRFIGCECRYELTKSNTISLTISLQEGAERDILFAIFQRGAVSESGTGVLSAFAWDEIKGAVYVEATSPVAVHTILQGIGRVIHSSAGPCIDLVPLDERMPLLKLAVSTPIQKMSWVRIKRGGKYRNHLAFVKSIDLRLWTAHVLLAPGAWLGGKRKKKRFVLVEDANANTQLLEQEFSLEDLSDSSVNATQSELDSFTRCDDELVLRALSAGVVTLKWGDKIRVLKGSLQGLEGMITDIHDHTLTFAPLTMSTATPSSIETSTFDVCKKFELGDYVQVMYGIHCGQEGFILEIDNSEVTIYNPQGADSEV